MREWLVEVSEEVVDEIVEKGLGVEQTECIIEVKGDENLEQVKETTKGEFRIVGGYNSKTDTYFRLIEEDNFNGQYTIEIRKGNNEGELIIKADAYEDFIKAIMG